MKSYEQIRTNMNTRVAAASLVAGVALAGCSGGELEYTPDTAATAEASPSPSPSPEPRPTPEVEICEEAWEITDYTNERGDSPRWFAEGLQSIKDANELEDEEAREAARDATNEWINKVKQDPKLLAAVLNTFSNAPELEAAKGVTIADLTDENDQNCVSEQAVVLTNQLTTFLNFTAEVDAAPADQNATNTGANDDGEVVQNAEPGVSGDETERAALEFTYVNDKGEVCHVWVLGRCGQLVTFEDCMPDLPEGKTDDGELPGNPDVPADQDQGTPDVPGEGPAGVTDDVNEDGYKPGENDPDPTPEDEQSGDDSTDEADGGTTGEGTPENPVVTDDEDQEVAPEEDAPTASDSDGEDNDGDGQVDEEDESSAGGSDPDTGSSPDEPEDPFGN